MTTNVICVFQSGEQVHTNGIYHVVGVDLAHDEVRKEHARRELRQGQCFPDYQGRAVCWLLVEILIEQVTYKEGV